MTELDVKPDMLLVMAEPARAEAFQAILKTSNLATRIVWECTAQGGLDFLFCEGCYASRNPTDKPRVVFLDLGASPDAGVKFIRDVKADDRLKRLPIVVLAPPTDDKSIQECYRNGGNSYVNLPEETEKFVELMVQVGRYWLAVNRSPG